MCGHAEEEQEPGLGIDESFDELIAFEMSVLDTSVIVSESFYSEFLLFRGQPAPTLRLVIQSSAWILFELTRWKDSRLE